MGTRIHSYTAPCPTLCILQGRVASYLALAVSSPSMNTKPLGFHTLGDLSPRDEESTGPSSTSHSFPDGAKGPAGSQTQDTQPFISYPRSLSPYRFYIAFSVPMGHTIRRCRGNLHSPLRGNRMQDGTYILVEGKGHNREAGSNPTLPQTDCVM